MSKTLRQNPPSPPKARTPNNRHHHWQQIQPYAQDDVNIGGDVVCTLTVLQ